MKKIATILGVCLFLTIESLGQEVRGKIFVNGEEFRLIADTETYFTFRPLRAKLSKHGRKYLNTFANDYLSKQKRADSLKIVIDPASTFKEQKVIETQIGFARGWTAHNYLKEKFGIEIANVRIKETRTVCVLRE
jgi:hypothetical protein